MKNDNFYLLAEHEMLSREASEKIFLRLSEINSPQVISVGGQSGSGKTTFAFALCSFLTSQNLTPLLIHQDDYFHLPPTFNHLSRVADLSWVGMQEVNMQLMNKHITDFKKRQNIYLPEMDYKNNSKSYQDIESKKYDTLIVEGTYVSILQNVDVKIFCSPTYKETLARRLKRNRDIMDDFTNEVLQIEERIIAPHQKLADMVLNNAFQIVEPSSV